MRDNNKGLSYVELILVMAIMAILIGVISLSVGLVSRTNVTRGVEKLSSTFTQARTTSMARGNTNGKLEISYDGSSYYYYVGNLSSPNKEQLKVEFLSSPAVVSYATEADPNTQIAITSTPLVITFNQSSGSIQQCSDGAGNVVSCGSITLTNGDTSATVKLYPSTGKCEVLY